MARDALGNYKFARTCNTGNFRSHYIVTQWGMAITMMIDLVDQYLHLSFFMISIGSLLARAL